MNIVGLPTNVDMASQSGFAGQVGTAVMSNTLDLAETLGQDLVDMMEQSVNPAVGGNINIRI